MKVIVTYCSGPKREDGGLLPAVDRYLSPRISGLHDRSVATSDAFRVLSGEYGLLEAGQPIPWYDHLLLPDEIDGLVPRVADALRDMEADRVEYHTADPVHHYLVAPYLAVMVAACRVVGIELEVIVLSGNPD